MVKRWREGRAQTGSQSRMCPKTDLRIGEPETDLRKMLANDGKRKKRRASHSGHLSFSIRNDGERGLESAVTTFM